MRVATEATVAAGCVALVVFATGPIILLRSPHLTNLIYMATIISGGIAFAAISASVFGRSAICAAAIAAATTAMFVFGEAFRSVGLDVLAHGPLPWWSENVMGNCLIGGVPVALAAAALSFWLCGRQRRSARSP